MFRRLILTFALQFTVFVFLIVVVTGGVYLTADYIRLRHDTDKQLQDMSDRIATGISNPSDGQPLSSQDLAYARLVSPDKTVQSQGEFFQATKLPVDIPSGSDHFSEVQVGTISYRLVTTPLSRNGQPLGWLQLAAPDIDAAALTAKIFAFLISSLGVSLLTFWLGIRFAESNLEPVRLSMERLEQFTQDASHELKTPLAALTSSLDLALKTGDYAKGLRSAKEDAGQATVLVERLLELARLDRVNLRRETFDMTALCAEVAATYRTLGLPRKVALTEELREGVRLQGDPALIRQLISNLVGNALKFTSEGSVTIRLTRQALEVVDTGPGIPKDQLPRIFDRFYQADGSRSREGFGLGLAIAQRIAEVHSWVLEAESTPGNGSVFRLKFVLRRS